MKPESTALLPSLDAKPAAALLDELYRQEVLQARAMPPEEKLLAGERLFAWACEITLTGIRGQFPEATEGQCLELLKQRLALRRQWEAPA
jgi:hypothetical protein